MTFRRKAISLQGKRVQVTATYGGTFTGTILSVGADFLILSALIRGIRRRRIIRLAEIVALLALI
ncbi:hypothetical protein Back11_14680 [Paenibacillus baekrokdamisoli]|uniref:Uncharacterized protein n=1 Tax=Paenibacillus baekrokdamisoli TaxID=1712516 RepID=A0A3G9J5Q7_9BACL|nr:hypothetical protein [Paenibacillus baekrokdamisoli]MBB3072732.1 hypothetical protein [Paenibacillus baekrokdamisoli]BBH20123.1 hypothetical protein Back11_14680 [Paenibacillus baekrokdamisoli]